MMLHNELWLVNDGRPDSRHAGQEPGWRSIAWNKPTEALPRPASDLREPRSCVARRAEPLL